MTQVSYDQIQPGWEVYSNDGDHIASVTDVNDAYITISKGLFLPKDYFIPMSGIAAVDPDQERIQLVCSKNDLDRMGWDQPATAETDRGQAYGETTQTTRKTDLGRGVNETAGTETQRMPVYEEELRAEKSARQAGEVNVTKDVTQEEQAFDVPVTREDVEVRRVAVNRPAGQAEGAFDDGQTIRVPVTEEQVQVTKEPRVVEEIEIRKNARQETQRVSDTVRREQVNVNQQGDVNVEGDRQLVGAGTDRFQGQGDLDQQDPAMQTRGAEFDESGYDRSNRGTFETDAESEADAENDFGNDRPLL